MIRRTKKIDCVLFGADRVAANGDVANKIGTYNVGEFIQLEFNWNSIQIQFKFNHILSSIFTSSSQLLPTKTIFLYMLLFPLPQSTSL